MANATKYGYSALYATIAATSSGANTIVAAVAGHKIRIISMFINFDSTNSLIIKSNTTNLTGTSEVEGGDQIILPPNEYGWLQTNTGEALIFTLGKNHGVSGGLTYFLT